MVNNTILKYLFLTIFLTFQLTSFSQKNEVLPGEYTIGIGTVLYKSTDLKIKIAQMISYTNVRVIRKLFDEYYLANYKGRTGVFNIRALSNPTWGFPKVDEKIKAEIISEYQEWLTKGEFETTNDFRERISQQNKEDQLNRITNNIYEKYKLSYISELASVIPQIGQYDADNETFLLTIDNTELFLKVPIKFAENFKLNFSNSDFYNYDASLSANNLWIITKFVVSNNKLNKKFYYDMSQSNLYDYKENVNIDVSDVEIALPKISQNKINLGPSDIDVDIPIFNSKNTNVYALVIGNEDYKSYQPRLSNESNVDFAVDDAKTFIKYLNQTIGVPQKNIIRLYNATGNQMRQAIEKIRLLSEVGQGKREIIFYYSGHGLPDKNTHEPYIIPVDVNGTNPEFGIKLGDIYKKLTEFPNKKVTVFLDACFSGGARNKPLVAMRNITVEPKQGFLNGNIVVFASSSDNQSSGMYLEKQHGLFTYFLLKKIKETKGDITYKELIDYLHEVVPTESLLVNDNKQKPTVRVGSKALNDWQNWKIK